MKVKGLIAISILLLISSLVYSEETTDLYIKDLGVKVSHYEGSGSGKGGDSDIPAIRKHESYLEAKQEALQDSANFLEGIKNQESRELRDVARENTMLIVVFEETLEEAKVSYREWDEEDNATVKVRIDLVEFKEKLDEIGVE